MSTHETVDHNIELGLRTEYHDRKVAPTAAREAFFMPIISADDHLMENDDTFVTRVASKYRDKAPRLIERNGASAWTFPNGTIEAVTSSNAAISFSFDDRVPGPVRISDMLPGAYDPAARVQDMSRDGVWASLLFPSINFGFAGQKFFQLFDPDAGLAMVRAYNDWILEELVTPFPQRFIQSQVTYLGDPEIAAAEVRRNAERGFRAVLFTENPDKLGLPSIHSGRWDPFFRACEETKTAICIHVGSSSHVIKPSSDSPIDAFQSAITVNPILATYDWLFSGVPIRFPGLKIILSEGGIDWVPLVYSRLVSQWRLHPPDVWPEPELTTVEVLFRNFFFSALWDEIGYGFFAEHAPSQLVVEVDYPHADSVYPHSQTHFARCMEGIDKRIQRQITYENAAKLFRHEPAPAGWTGEADG